MSKKRCLRSLYAEAGQSSISRVGYPLRTDMVLIIFKLNSYLIQLNFIKKTNGNEKNNGLNVMNYHQDCVKKLKMYFVHKSPYLEFLIKLDLKKDNYCISNNALRWHSLR